MCDKAEHEAEIGRAEEAGEATVASSFSERIGCTTGRSVGQVVICEDGVIE